MKIGEIRQAYPEAYDHFVNGPPWARSKPQAEAEIDGYYTFEVQPGGEEHPLSSTGYLPTPVLVWFSGDGCDWGFWDPTAGEWQS